MSKPLLTDNEQLNAFRRKSENGELKNDNGNIIAIILRNTDLTTYEVPNYEHLVYLNLSGNENLKEVTFSNSLPNLRHFDSSDSKVKSLRFDVGFTSLEWLDASRNELKEIQLESDLPNLQYLGFELSLIHI